MGSPEFRNFIVCRETQIGASILYDSSRENYRAFLDSLDRSGLFHGFRLKVRVKNIRESLTLIDRALPEGTAPGI